MKFFMLRSSQRLALLLGLMVCLFTTWGGLRIWDNWTRSDPVRVVLVGGVPERRKAAYDLRSVTADRDIEKAMAVLAPASEDKDVEVRVAAVASLSGLASEIVRRPDRTPAEQDWTKRRLEVATGALTRAISDPEPAVRVSAVLGFGELAKGGKVALPPEVVAALKDDSKSVRQATFEALGAVRLTTPAVPTLIEALGSRDREDRFHAAWLLQRLGPEAKSAVPALLAILKQSFDLEESKTTRPVDRTGDPACTAARALGQIGASEEVIASLAVMLSSDVPERVSCAALGLGDLGPRAVAAVPQLIAAYDRVLRSKSHVIGQMSISDAIGRIAPKSPSASDAIAILVRALDSGDEWVRRGAIQALGNFGKDAAAVLPKLRTLERDPAKDVRIAASAAIVAIEAASVDSLSVRSR